MQKTVKGTLKNGVICPSQPLELPAGIRLELEIKTVGGAAELPSGTAKEMSERRSLFLKRIRAFTDKNPEVFKNLRFTRRNCMNAVDTNVFS